jgi:hypothetical protein
MLELDRIQELNQLAASNNARNVVIEPGAGNAPVLLSAPSSRWRALLRHALQGVQVVG